MIVAAAIIAGLGLAMLVLGLVYRHDALRLERTVWDRDQARAAALAERERGVDLLRESLVESYAERERMWAEERRSLLDRIQDPAAVQIERIRREMATDPRGESDDDVDKKFAASAAAAVPWDEDLALLAEQVPASEEG